jgi:hypothetical protein
MQALAAVILGSIFLYWYYEKAKELDMDEREYDNDQRFTK